VNDQGIVLHCGHDGCQHQVVVTGAISIRDMAAHLDDEHNIQIDLDWLTIAEVMDR
jgi:hypothetical protein